MYICAPSTDIGLRRTAKQISSLVFRRLQHKGVRQFGRNEIDPARIGWVTGGNGIDHARIGRRVFLGRDRGAPFRAPTGTVGRKPSSATAAQPHPNSPAGRPRRITRLSLTADPQEPSVPAGLAGDNRPQPSSPHQHQKKTAPASPTNFRQSPIRIRLAGLSPTPSLRKPTNHRSNGLRTLHEWALRRKLPCEPTDALPDSPRALPGRARPHE